jgi:hypothetical protein
MEDVEMMDAGPVKNIVSTKKFFEFIKELRDGHRIMSLPELRYSIPRFEELIPRGKTGRVRSLPA